ncbi:sulfite exporter TauE/SafE family protein [Plantactinospora sp. GCM10030261]|uniref:sulfite exporter TauE/SafE family protein n=1 Tax=Plantactinospora sp. GCM10030261 TaxID=3273420 RepID=UPI0036069F00
MLDQLVVLAAGVAAGAINAVVGSGTLITFPVLLALGYPPVVANASNTVGLVPGSLSGAYGYRAELVGRRRLLLPLMLVGLVGGVTGAALLLVLPATAFEFVVPWLIGVAVLLVAAQPRLARWLRRSRTPDGVREPAGSRTPGATPPGPTGRLPGGRAGVLLLVGAYGTSVYGGYFGAAQGVLLLGVLGVLLPEKLQSLNGIKNLLTALVNGVAAVVFLGAGQVAWQPALLIAAGSVVGGLLGARYGRRLPDTALRALIVAVGLTALVRMAT